MKTGFYWGAPFVANIRHANRPSLATGVLLLLLFFSAAAGAADWVIVHTSRDGDRYSYDASKLAMSSNEITYWKKVTFRSAQPYKGSLAASALYRERINCTEYTLKSLNYVIHAASGAVIEQVATESEATAIVPDTVGDVFERILCPILKSRREEPPLKPQPQPHAKWKEKVEAPAAPVKEKFDTPVPAVKEKVEAPVSPEKEKIEPPAPPAKEKVEAPAPPVKEKFETPAPPAKEKIESPAPPAKEKVEAPAPLAKEKFEAPALPAKEKIETPAPPEKAKTEAPVPSAFNDESGLL